MLGFTPRPRHSEPADFLGRTETEQQTPVAAGQIAATALGKTGELAAGNFERDASTDDITVVLPD